MLQLSVTALFYLEDSRKIHLRGVRARWSKDTGRRAPQRAGERERESWLWLLYLYVYPSLGLSYVNWASQECCLFHLRSSLRSSELLLFHFCGLFPSLSCSHHHFGLLFPVLLPNNNITNECLYLKSYLLYSKYGQSMILFTIIQLIDSTLNLLFKFVLIIWGARGE